MIHVAEIVSRGQSPLQVGEKAKVWLGAGVQLVWVVSPKTRSLDVYRLAPEVTVTTLREPEELDAAPVLPDFSYPLARLWE